MAMSHSRCSIWQYFNIKIRVPDSLQTIVILRSLFLAALMMRYNARAATSERFTEKATLEHHDEVQKTLRSRELSVMPTESKLVWSRIQMAQYARCGFSRLSSPPPPNRSSAAFRNHTVSIPSCSQPAGHRHKLTISRSYPRNGRLCQSVSQSVNQSVVRLSYGNYPCVTNRLAVLRSVSWCQLVLAGPQWRSTRSSLAGAPRHCHSLPHQHMHVALQTDSQTQTGTIWMGLTALLNVFSQSRFPESIASHTARKFELLIHERSSLPLTESDSFYLSLFLTFRSFVL